MRQIYAYYCIQPTKYNIILFLLLRFLVLRITEIIWHS